MKMDCWTAETYRDKLDVLLERAEKIDNFEAKLLRSKDKMNKIEFFWSQEWKRGRAMGKQSDSCEDQINARGTVSLV